MGFFFRGIFSGHFSHLLHTCALFLFLFLFCKFVVLDIGKLGFIIFAIGRMYSLCFALMLRI